MAPENCGGAITRPKRKLVTIILLSNKALKALNDQLLSGFFMMNQGKQWKVFAGIVT